MEVECTLPIDSSLLKYGAPVSYKYLIHSRPDESEASTYEFLHGAPGGRGVVINRKLAINENDFKDRGMINSNHIYWVLDIDFYVLTVALCTGQYHQYDSMVYPEGAKTKGIVTKVVNFFVGQSSKEEALYVPDHDTMQEKVLEVFLENYRSNLVGLELSHHLDVVQIAKRIAHIFRQLYIQKISQSRERVWTAGKLPAVSVCKVYMIMCTVMYWTIV